MNEPVQTLSRAQEFALAYAAAFVTYHVTNWIAG